MIRSIWWTAIFGLTAACGTPGAKPHDMSAAQHDRDAETHDAAASTHPPQYDPNATVDRRNCLPTGGGGSTSGAAFGGGCWTSVSNPTTEHLRAAEDHRRQAMDHRAASSALRDAEAGACAGISPDDRDMSPFDHGEDMAGVAPLTESTGSSKAPSQRAAGAIGFDPLP